MSQACYSYQEDQEQSYMYMYTILIWIHRKDGWTARRQSTTETIMCIIFSQPPYVLKIYCKPIVTVQHGLAS